MQCIDPVIWLPDTAEDSPLFFRLGYSITDSSKMQALFSKFFCFFQAFSLAQATIRSRFSSILQPLTSSAVAISAPGQSLAISARLEP